MNGDGDQVVAHLVRALVAHRRWCRSRGHQFPEVMEALLDAVAATNGPDRSPFGETPDPAETDHVTLLLTDASAAQLLNVSERTIRRLRKSEALPTVLVGRRRFIRPEDIAAFIASGGA